MLLCRPGLPLVGGKSGVKFTWKKSLQSKPGKTGSGASDSHQPFLSLDLYERFGGLFSRFARNTTIVLEVVRELKALNVQVIFVIADS